MPRTAANEPFENSYDETSESRGGVSTAAGGCGFLLYFLAVTTGMLIVNAIVCLSIHSAVMSFGPQYMRDTSGLGPHLAQLFFYIVPVVLTVLQWNLLDRLNRLFRGR
jgi:hypothetical protein